MLECIFFVFLIILATLGFIEILKILLLKFFNFKYTSYTPKEILVIPLNEKSENLEIFLRKLIFKMKWNKRIDNQRIIFLDLGMDRESKRIYNIINKDYGFLCLSNLDKLPDFFKNTIDNS